MLADVDAAVGAFPTQVNTGQDHGRISRVEVFVARSHARVHDRDRHARTASDAPGASNAHLIKNDGLLLDVPGRVHRAGLFLTLLGGLRRRIRRRRRGGGTHARRGRRVRVRDHRAERGASPGLVRGGGGSDDRREREPRHQRSTDEAVAKRPDARAVPAHESPTDEAAACGVRSEPGGMMFAQASGMVETLSWVHPSALMGTMGVGPSEWMYPWSDTKA